jgi:hypothetical protein
MIRRCAVALLACLLLAAPATAKADFGFVPGSVEAVAENQDGTLDNQASSHPYAYTTSFAFKTDESGHVEGGEPREIIVDLPPGLVGNPLAVPRCPRQLFEGLVPLCPGNTQVGILHATVSGIGEVNGPIFNMIASPGLAAQIGFSAASYNAIQNGLVRTEEGYGLRIDATNIPLEVSATSATIWGVPADPSHDPERKCIINGSAKEGCASDAPLLPFLTLPASCDAPPEITIKADSKLAPGVYDEQSALSLDGGGNPASLAACEVVPFQPKSSTKLTTKLAENPSGLDFELKLPNQGLMGPNAITETEPKKIEVTLPEGVTLNPSAAEGIGVCSLAQYKAEQIDARACPEASKLGSITARSPLLEETIEGSLYLAKPYDNPFNKLLTLYIVARAKERGVLIKLAGKVEPDPKTGQLVTTFDNLVPLPYSDFELHFREGGRAPLVSPPACGTYQTIAKMTPFSSDQPLLISSPFKIERGVDAGSCPPGGIPPFKPEFTAGSLNNNAKSYSPFYMRLIRHDGEQDMTKFSSILPPGVLGKLAGVSKCPDSAVAIAKAKTGLQEIANPSCPANSQIGRTLAGAGVGSVLTYVPGKLYLGGPYKGNPLSVIVITPAVAGPFDVGTVVVREALTLNPETAEVEADGKASDPIPHILAGIPLKVRDLRVYVDRKDFILNPTSCDPSSAKATLFGSFLDVFNPADDIPISLNDRYQAANCASLGFKPKLSINLKGGTRRGDHPALKAIVNARPSDANIGGAVVTLPTSAFLDQAHIRTICTRVQFAAKSCPKGAQYGYARAFTPLLDEPVEGPVYLRSSSHKLPDLVASLHGIVDVDIVGRIDSFKGGIRSSFETTPDAPVTKFVLSMQGGKKGLVVNSRNLCAQTSRADARFTGQNGKVYDFRPVVRATGCGGKGRKRR